MAERTSPAYGTPNWEMLRRWLQLTPAADGPFWALNLMQYHQVAQYGDGTAGVSGRDADDAYTPLGPLAAVGAVPAFHGDVVDQRLGAPRWDRVGVVRYPSRAAFFAMQQRDDFKAQHVHKEAGMAFTIVMSCLPRAHDAAAPTEGSLVLVVDRGGEDPDPKGAVEAVRFEVEGVIVGDERTFDRARFLRLADGSALDALVDAASSADDAHVLVIEPAVDRLVETIVTATREDG
jgi:hypothetical protein